MLSNLNISRKLFLMIAIFVLALLAIGGYAVHALDQAQARNAAVLQITRNTTTAVDSARAAEVAFTIQIQEFKDILLRGHDPSDFERYVSSFNDRGEVVTRELVTTRAAAVKIGVGTDEIDQATRMHANATREYLEALKQFEPRKPETTQTVEHLVRGKDRPVEGKMEEIITQLNQYTAIESTRLAAAAAAEADKAKQWLILEVVVVLALAIALALQTSRSVSSPMRKAVAAAEQIASGDLTLKFDIKGRDETAKMLRALSTMTESLRQLVGEVAHGARTVAHTSAQIAQGNLDLSQRTEEQATTLEETASSMEELTSTVAHNADNARQASQLAVSASEVARKGGEVVGQVVSTMTNISQSSRKIGDIIGVIDGIAFQTNILALNAAVEAARAGEQGRGFAVVAAEVRGLAQRSAAAAKEIKSLIGDSVSMVETGTKLVDSAGTTMEEIVSSVKKVSDLIAEIAAASQEQSAGIGQVNTAVAQMEQVVQQNATLVEEATAATESMKEQASSLLQVVSHLKLDDEAAPVLITPLEPAIDERPSATPAPTPIKVRQSTALPPAYAGAIAGDVPKPRNPNGGWEEF